jgi:tetratricopeptide (TPR) repeat protein
MVKLVLRHVKSQERRKFLIQSGRMAAAFLWPPRFQASADPDFHLHPHYRQQTAVDNAQLLIQPGRDGFLNEQRHEKMAALFDSWARELRQSSRNVKSLGAALSGRFKGGSWKPLSSRALRTGFKTLTARRLWFSEELSLPPDAFLLEVQDNLVEFSQILTAEFQITRIDSFESRVRYEFVGTGSNFFREQRIGEWSIDWDRDFKIVRWEMHEEVRSRAQQRCFVDTSQSAFGENSSYGGQMLHGADYWRTVLDGASGIDIYGHNGVSVGDLYGTGFDDIYVCQPAGLPNRLYRNRGNGTFEDVTERSGLGLLDNTACALIADFDNDGRQDVVVVRANGPLLFLNQGNGKFQMKRGAFQFAQAPQGTFTSAAAADYDRDGRLDLYFCLYSFYQGSDQYNYPTPYFAAENGPANFMMHNDGDGTFRDVTAQCGMDQNNTRYSFCCGWNDFNGDGWPDLYVVNDFGKKNLYRNHGDGTFSDVAAEVGVEDIGAGMSVCWFDYNNDGAEDLYVANMWTAAGERITRDKDFQNDAPEQLRAIYQKHAMGNSLLLNGGHSQFRDVTADSNTGMGRWAWGSDAWDFNHDGLADLYIANGMISGVNRQELNSFFWRQVVAKSPNEAKPSTDYEQGWKAINEWIRDGYTWSGYERNVLYMNHGDGTFSDVSGALGLDFIEDGRSFALADFDGDGKQEMLLKSRNAPQLRLIKNTIPDLPPSIAFRLKGTKSNRDAIGAVVKLGRQTKSIQAGSGFLAQHSKEVFFGLGETGGEITATIRWPSGMTQQVGGLRANQRVWVTEGVAEVRSEPFKQWKASTASMTTPVEDSVPATIETWLLVPITAPSLQRGSKLVTFKTEASFSEDFSAVYNLLFRNIFDQHRDMPLPTSFLLDDEGQIVKVYQGPVSEERVQLDLKNIPRTTTARLAQALPFPGVADTYEFGRNYLSLGSIFFQRDYLDSAADFFRSATESAESLYGLGSVYLKQEKNKQAEDCFERAVKLNAGYPETLPNAWNNLGILATRAGDTEKAVGRFKRALELSPEHFVALENLGNAYRQQRRWEDARATLERALRIKPDDADANYSLGMVLAQGNDTLGAYQHLQKALQARPDYPEALNNLGILYLRTQRRDQAVAQFEKCIQLAPTFDQAYLNLARVYAIEGNAEKARTVLQALLAQRPHHAAALQALEQLR